MKKLLIGSPVRQKPLILKEFLTGFEEADFGEHEVAYCFIDDNAYEESSKLLRDFATRNDVVLFKGDEVFNNETSEDASFEDHSWRAIILKKVTDFKNKIIEYCIDNKFDYLFLIDSDIVIDKRSILQLISDDVEIVSNVFWNQWVKNGQLTAQCFWIPDIYLQEKEFCVMRPFEESHKIRWDFYEKLKTPGLYEVDGLGACTLIKLSALEKGVNFTEIPNLKIPGEDRPFCIRAGVAGIPLYMDTHYPAYHISRDIFLDRVDEFKREGWKFDMCQTFEPEPVKKKMNAVQKFIYRAASKVARDLNNKYEQ